MFFCPLCSLMNTSTMYKGFGLHTHILYWEFSNITLPYLSKEKNISKTEKYGKVKN